MTTQSKQAPDWAAIQLPAEYLEDLRRLKEERNQLHRLMVVGNAFISYMASPQYADSDGEHLGMAFLLLSTHTEA